MTVQTTENRINQNADGVKVQYDFNFQVNDPAHIKVYFNGVEQTSGFTVTLNADQNASPGGNVTFATAPPLTDPVTVVTIQRVVPNTQPVDWTPYDEFPAEVLERSQDDDVFRAQQLTDEVQRSLKAGVSTPPGTSYELPSPDAGRVLQWNQAANGIENGPTTQEIEQAKTDAQNSATAAATSASNAATSESNANTSAANAAASATTAENTLKDFATRYLGAKISDPAVDNEGNPLIDGALYFNTTSNVIRVYDLGNTLWKDITVAEAISVIYNNTSSGLPAANVQAGMDELVKRAAKAWVNFNGADGTIRSSYNVSSVVRNSAGNYTVNFSNPMSDVNYVPMVTGYDNGNLNGTLGTTPKTVNSVNITYRACSTNTYTDTEEGNVAIFGN